jgi:hypothetical protein
MLEELFLLLDDDLFLGVLGLGFPPAAPPVEIVQVPAAGGRAHPRPSVYYVPFHPREDDIEEQLEQAAHLAMLQQLTEARGVQAAQRLYDKRIEDARALSLLSARRNATMAADPLHRPQPVTAASLQKQLKQERERPSILPKNMQDDLLKMKRDAALQEANRVRTENKRREEEIQRTRLANLEKARKARKKK